MSSLWALPVDVLQLAGEGCLLPDRTRLCAFWPEATPWDSFCRGEGRPWPSGGRDTPSSASPSESPSESSSSSSSSSFSSWMQRQLLLSKEVDNCKRGTWRHPTFFVSMLVAMQPSRHIAAPAAAAGPSSRFGGAACASSSAGCSIEARGLGQPSSGASASTAVSPRAVKMLKHWACSGLRSEEDGGRPTGLMHTLSGVGSSGIV
mmetsp:Transcript_7621/g.24240  ORF Transcript_7621/g.24240 Transcript_7621/m.24240 type:complete len:205 (+) Transcript_7621:302-916(+)